MSEIKSYGKVAMTFEGEWDENRVYDRLCVVTYNKLSYVSNTDNVAKGVIPPNSRQWNLLSAMGPKGDQGPKGDRGQKGEDGKPGLNAISYKNVVAFITHEPTKEKPYPDKPIGGFWDVESDIVILPDGWTNTDNIPAPIWMSNGTFSSLNPDNPTWTTPQRISGEKGNNGVDGISQEFIYCLTKNQNIQPPVIINSNTDDYVPAGWEPSPKGIDEYNQVEWYASRKKDSLGNWLDFEGPFIWSKWGVNGLDGDGVQYIFRRNNGEALKNPIEEFNIEVNSDEYQEKGDYENIEYVPTDWRDNPQGVDPTHTHEWCCKRKFRNGVWGEYSDPALWAKYGEDGYNGISIKTKYAVTDNSTEVPPIDKTDKNPGSSWGSIIPHYESPQALWETQAYVDYKGDLVEVTDDDETIIYGWCDPILKSGVAGEKGAVPNYKSTYFCKADSIPNKPTYKTLSEVESSSIWLDYPNDSGQWWQSTAVIDGTTEEIISWGNVLQVNGRDGDAQDGRYWETRFAASPDDSAPELNKYDRYASTNTVTWIKVDADTPPPTIPEGGSLWQIWAEIESDGMTLVDGWSDPYRVNGERGPRGYQGATGEPGPQGPSGLHGIDIVVLYCLGNETDYLADSAPSEDYYGGWYENIPEIEDEEKEQGYIYVWACQGTKVYTDNDGSFYYDWGEPFRLSGLNGLGEKGVGIEDVRNYYAISDSDAKVPSDWGNEGEIPQVSEDYPYLWNYEVIEYTDGTEKETTPQVISVKGANGRNITEIIEYYYVGPEEEGVTIEDYSWVTTPLYPNDVDIYLWNYEEIVFDKGESIKTDPIRIGNYAKGEKGPLGKIVYPAGVYNNNTVYKTTETTCPYVLDTDYGNYYILNADEWDATVQKQTPGQSFEKYGSKYWTKMDFYEAIFAKVGVIANGLFGSAVFNGDYMFSQQGLNNSGEFSTDYHLFGQDINGNLIIDNIDFNLTRTDLAFYPNICFNFKTGATNLGKNSFTIDNEGNVKIGKFTVSSKGLEYTLEDSKTFYINDEGIGCVDEDDTYYMSLQSDGRADFAKGKVRFYENGTFDLGDVIIKDYFDNRLIIKGVLNILDKDGNNTVATIGNIRQYENIQGTEYKKILDINNGAATILEDGSAIFNKLSIKEGVIEADIDSGGIFKGALDNVSGTINGAEIDNTTIKNSRIIVDEDQTFNIHNLNIINNNSDINRTSESITIHEVKNFFGLPNHLGDTTINYLKKITTAKKEIIRMNVGGHITLRVTDSGDIIDNYPSLDIISINSEGVEEVIMSYALYGENNTDDYNKTFTYRPISSTSCNISENSEVYIRVNYDLPPGYYGRKSKLEIEFFKTVLGIIYSENIEGVFITNNGLYAYFGDNYFEITKSGITMSE